MALSEEIHPISSCRRVNNDMNPREALSRRQERLFLEFVENDGHFSRYYDAMFILFNTGLRISEFSGLTPADLDFKNGSIRVCGQLMRDSGMNYYVEKPKTPSGARVVPMSDRVADSFRSILRSRSRPEGETIVDGVGGFLMLDKNGRPLVALHWEHYFKHAREKYNRIYREGLPKVTPHVCRHTFCSKMARNGMSPAKLKYVMGHSSIDTTFNVYAHMDFEGVREDMLRCLRDKGAA